MSPSFPVDSLKPSVLSRLGKMPLCLSSPTGSGKSTQVPRWCARHGRVLVIEPRRVACKSLASFVAKLEGTELGHRVGYRVRAERRDCADTAILFATPGVVLRMLSDDATAGFDTIILDEFHERTLELDLLLGLLHHRCPQRLIVMSATIAGDAIARHLSGEHLTAEGRQFPVTVNYHPLGADLPHPDGLGRRVRSALALAANDPGDVLVFLPGKGEIKRVQSELEDMTSVSLLPLHGGLSLDQQSRVFEPTPKRKVILTTNVAETSLTVDGVGVVIDTGLVRRTRYAAGRGFLTLVPIATDSADQRAGRAGRTAPGICYRLWSKTARLDPRTPPEIHREALDPLVLAAAACGHEVSALPLLDPPKEYALMSAVADLVALSALTKEAPHRITERGRKLFGLPLDAALGRLLLEAENTPLLNDVVDLVAALSTRRPLLTNLRADDETEDLRRGGCDATALIRAVRTKGTAGGQVDRAAAEEARLIARRLRDAFAVPSVSPGDDIARSELLAKLVLRADPRRAHVVRRRKRETVFASGGTELELARESAVDVERTEAVVVLTTRAVGLSDRDQKLLITSAIPARYAWLAEQGIGEERVEAPSLKDGEVIGRVERVFAGQVLTTQEQPLLGSALRSAAATLILQNRLVKGTARMLCESLAESALVSELLARDLIPAPLAAGLEQTPLPAAPLDYLVFVLETLGVQDSKELAVLSRDDFSPPPLSPSLRQWLEKEWPTTVRIPGADYRVQWDLARRTATLIPDGRTQKSLPEASTLPTLQRFAVVIDHQGRLRTVRKSLWA